MAGRLLARSAHRPRPTLAMVFFLLMAFGDACELAFEEEHPGGFRDVADSVHVDGIVAVAEEGIADGYPDATFRPGEEVTRGQMATFLARALDLEPAPDAGFEDVEGLVHEGAVGAVAQAGIADGFGDGTFRPQEPVTRGQTATFLARALDLEPAPEAGFEDVEGTAHEAAVGAVAQAGIADGFDDGTFRPNEPVTRGQMATFLARALGLD